MRAAFFIGSQNHPPGTVQPGMQTQIPGAMQPGTRTQAAQTNTRAAAQTQPQDAMQSGMQPQIQGTMQPDGQPQTQGTTQPNFQTQVPGESQPNAQAQVPGESQPNAQAQTEKGQPLSPEKRIADLASDIKKSGLTTGKATIAAQTLYQTAQQYGPNAEAMLAAYEPGQDPKRFASGFQNAYILGTQGNQAALQNSKAAAYLTQEQKEIAYSIGSKESKNPTNKTGNIFEKEHNRKNLLSVLDNSTIDERGEMFKKAFQSGQISTRISPQKQARHIQGTKQFLEHDKKLSAKGYHSSYIKENLAEADLRRLVVEKLEGNIKDVPGHYYEYVTCDQPIGYYYSMVDKEYVETCCAQVAYAVAEGNLHIIPVKELRKGEQ